MTTNRSDAADRARTVEQLAASLNLKNYTALVRGEYCVVYGVLKGSGTLLSALSGPEEISPDLEGVMKLQEIGFSEIDAVRALGLNRDTVKRWRASRRRAESKIAKDRRRAEVDARRLQKTNDLPKSTSGVFSLDDI